MAIIVERKTKTINWLALSIGLFALIFVAAVVYYLFLAPTPGIEGFIVPPSSEIEVAKGAQEILGSGIDAESVLQKLEPFEDQIPSPTPGELGRDNPFRPI